MKALARQIFLKVKKKNVRPWSNSFDKFPQKTSKLQIYDLKFCFQDPFLIFVTYTTLEKTLNSQKPCCHNFCSSAERARQPKAALRA